MSPAIKIVPIINNRLLKLSSGISFEIATAAPVLDF